MASSTSPAAAFPDWRVTSIGLVVGYTLSVTLAAFFGKSLVELLLPLMRNITLWADDRFEILYFGIERSAQDTVIRLRVNLLRMLVVGTHVVQPQPKGWLEVSTTLGAILQPMTIGLGLALAWPGPMVQRLGRAIAAFAGSLLFMMIDAPLSLHAYLWDIFLQAYDATHTSPLMAVHRFLNNGGRLGVGIAIGLLGILFFDRQSGSRQSTPAPLNIHGQLEISVKKRNIVRSGSAFPDGPEQRRPENRQRPGR